MDAALTLLFLFRYLMWSVGIILFLLYISWSNFRRRSQRYKNLLYSLWALSSILIFEDIIAMLMFKSQGKQWGDLISNMIWQKLQLNIKKDFLESQKKFSEILLTIGSIVAPIYLGIKIIKRDITFSKIGFIILMLGLGFGILYLNTIGGGTYQKNEMMYFSSEFHALLSNVFFSLQWWMIIFGYTAAITLYFSNNRS
jgi:hypothetical protein